MYLFIYLYSFICTPIHITGERKTSGAKARASESDSDSPGVGDSRGKDEGKS